MARLFVLSTRTTPPLPMVPTATSTRRLLHVSSSRSGPVAPTPLRRARSSGLAARSTSTTPTMLLPAATSMRALRRSMSPATTRLPRPRVPLATCTEPTLAPPTSVPSWFQAVVTLSHVPTAEGRVHQRVDPAKRGDAACTGTPRQCLECGRSGHRHRYLRAVPCMSHHAFRCGSIPMVVHDFIFIVIWTLPCSLFPVSDHRSY
jgi:hypothetical protein